MSALHELSINDEQLRYLLALLTWQDGIGYDLYCKFRNVAQRDGLVPVPPQMADRLAIVGDCRRCFLRGVEVRAGICGTCGDELREQEKAERATAEFDRHSEIAADRAQVRGR